MADEPRLRGNRLALLKASASCSCAWPTCRGCPASRPREGSTVQHLRSLIYTAMLFLTTAFFAVLVIF
jgi:hypothetical protein